MRKLLILVLILLTLCIGGRQPAAAGEMTLMAFNVGKGDCLLLRSGESCYLIDTGKAKHADFLQEGLAALGVTHLDGVVITHMDSDHVGGLKKLLKSDLSIDHVYISAFYHPEGNEGKQSPGVKTATKQGYEAEELQGGDELPFDGGKLLVLGPVREADDKDDNNSIVLLAEAAGARFLLAGDMEFPEEADLLKAGVIPEADVLKIGNHGDDDATSTGLLSAVKPRIAVISTSTEEKASTPAKRVLEALAAWNAEVYQTQEAEWGILITASDGKITAERVDTLK